MKKKLARRQLEILQLISEGFTAVEIGKQLGISHRTVNVQVTSMFSKTGAKNAPHLIKLSIINGDIKLK